MFTQLSIQFLTVPIDIQSGDVDGDGIPEIFVLSSEPKKDMPDGRRVDLYAWTGSTYAHKTQISLSNKALIWDIQNGWWGINANGLVDVSTNTVLVESYSWLSTLGPTTPISADIAFDLNNDGLAEMIWPEQGQWRIFSVDGHDWGSIASTVSGQLQHSKSRGGLKHRVTHESASLHIADVDGQGGQDILLIAHQEALVTLTREKALGASYRIQLPIDVEPQEDHSRPGGKELSNVWFRDINGDGRMDMAWQYWVTKDSWFGATAELGMALGDGRQFGAQYSTKTDYAIVDVRWADWNASGTSDLLLLGVDLGMGTLARALLSKSVSLSLYVQPSAQNGFGEARVIWTLSTPIDGSDDVDYDVGFDWTGDQLPDMLLLQGAQLELYTNQGKEISAEKNAHIAVPNSQKLKVIATPKGHFALTWGQESHTGQLSWLGEPPF